MEWKLASVYDLTFSIGPRGEHQTAVMGESCNPGRAGLLRLAADSVVHAATAVAAIDKVSAVASGVATFLADIEIRKSTRKTVFDAVGLNVKRCFGGDAGQQ